MGAKQSRGAQMQQCVGFARARPWLRLAPNAGWQRPARCGRGQAARCTGLFMRGASGLARRARAAIVSDERDPLFDVQWFTFGIPFWLPLLAEVALILLTRRRRARPPGAC